MAAVLKVLKDDDDRWLVVLRDDRGRARQDSDDVVILAARDTQTDAEQVAQDWAAQDWARSLG
jgi:phosphopantetheine adenylyltransferase